MTFLQALRSCWALFASFTILVLGHGLLNSLLGVKLTLAGYTTDVAGLVLAGFFVGIVTGALLSPRLVQRVGHIRVFAAMAGLASVAALVHAALLDPWLWGAMRALAGFALTSMYVVVESWVNDRAQNTFRGRLLAVYMILWLISMAAGQLLIDVADPAGSSHFLLIAGFFSACVVPLALATQSAPDYSSPARVPLFALWRIAPLATVAAAMVGLIHGTLVGMASVYAQSADYSTREVALFTAAIYVGGIVLQLPIGRLADRVERRLVLAGITLAAAGAALLALWLSERSFAGLLAATALLGGLCLPFYSLTLAIANDRLSQNQMVGASATIYLLVGIGAIAGPPIAGLVMERVGTGGFFLYLAATQAALGLFALYRRTRTAPAPESCAADPVAPGVPPPTEAQAGSATQ
ncbi:MAG TPA: MFS transporter [Kiloniellales bacterium]|nr:MFS transporter [Kiloniellales bacterium]